MGIFSGATTLHFHFGELWKERICTNRVHSWRKKFAAIVTMLLWEQILSFQSAPCSRKPSSGREVTGYIRNGRKVYGSAPIHLYICKQYTKSPACIVSESEPNLHCLHAQCMDPDSWGICWYIMKTQARLVQFKVRSQDWVFSLAWVTFSFCEVECFHLFYQVYTWWTNPCCTNPLPE